MGRSGFPWYLLVDSMGLPIRYHKAHGTSYGTPLRKSYGCWRCIPWEGPVTSHGKTHTLYLGFPMAGEKSHGTPHGKSYGYHNQSCTPASKIGTGYPTGCGAVEAEPKPATRVPADTGTRVPGLPYTICSPLSVCTRVPEYPGYHTLFAPLVALERWRGKQGRF